jgi:hypothetical protein
LHRAIDIVGVGVSSLVPRLPGRGVKAVQVPPGMRIDPLAADEKPGSLSGYSLDRPIQGDLLKARYAPKTGRI